MNIIKILINLILIFKMLILNVTTTSQYTTADYIWDTLKSYGYSDYIAAGIMGNIMVECAGGSFEINPYAENHNYYGICQWSKVYCSDIYGASLEDQCLYLKETISAEINIFGYLYTAEFNYDSFLRLQDASQAALAFAQCYERCYSGTYTLRQQCAQQAYNKFVGR